MQFHVTIEVTNAARTSWEPIDVLVDTGATYTKVPRPVLERLGIHPHTTRRARIANGQVIERQIGEALIRIPTQDNVPSAPDEANTNQVTFAEPGETLLLGCLTLESFSLGVDPINQRLIPIEALEL